MRIHDYISSHPKICHGKPVFAGTRIMVSLVLELLEAGESIDNILESYPSLTREHVRAALHLASQLVERSRLTRLNI